MTRKQLRKRKKESALILMFGIFLIILGIIPVVLCPYGDQTGSLFVWIWGGFIVIESIRDLWMLNHIKPKRKK